MRPTPTLLAVAALAALLGACGRPCPCCPVPSPSPAPAPKQPTSDRASDRRAVYAAVLQDGYRRADTQRYVLDPALVSLRKGDPKFERLLREWFPEARADTRDELSHLRPGATMPLDLVADLPVEWLGHADWSRLRVPASESFETSSGTYDVQWEVFHRRFPGSVGWISFSDVAFSKDGAEALVDVTSTSGLLDGATHLVLLARTPRGWEVRKKHRTAVS